MDYTIFNVQEKIAMTLRVLNGTGSKVIVLNLCVFDCGRTFAARKQENRRR